MKKILYSAFAAFLLSFTSCDKDYLDTAPTNAVSDQDVFSTTEGAWGAINGMHRAMHIRYSAQDQTGQGSVMLNMDMLGEDIVNTSTGNGWWINTYRWLTHRNQNHGTVIFVYRYYYKLIANANMIIENIDAATGPTADKNAIKGQALAYRAWAHHQLVQIFGERYVAGENNDQLGVPLMLTVTKEGQPRATVEEVYTQINKDLDDAISILPVTRNAKSHINLNVAKGMKARVALTMQNWAEAARLAVEAREGFPLMSHEDYVKGFNDVEINEWMWGSDQVQDQQTYFASFFAQISFNFNSTNIRTNPKAIYSVLYDKISETDIRKQLWDPTGTDPDFTPPASTYARKPYVNKKFLTAAGSGVSIGDVPYMRAAEMYLIEAEAKARLGQDAAAAEALYPLAVNRDPEYVKSTNTGQALIDEIMVQRRIELWGEGFRFLDLKRTNSPLDRTGGNHISSVAGNLFTVPAGDVRWQWLFPQREINPNPSIVQNPLD